ncbi:MAG: HD domain-containing protein [Candidatus Paceibacterota bacterium]
MPSVKELLAAGADLTKEDSELIEKAYYFAEKAHAPQKRFSGEPYFNHVYATALNLAKIGMGPNTIIAGLLHDVLEDAEVDQATIKNEFSEEILFLVEGVTKLGKIRYHGAQRHTKSLQKLFVAMAQDLRVIIIKLADRLHNMQTLEHVPPEKQKRIALETLEIYAPLAYRLGIRKFTRELEDLAFKYAFPAEYEQTRKLFREKNKENEKRLQKFAKSTIKTLALGGQTHIRIEFRLKSIYNTFRKLKTHNMDIEKIYDLSAMRIICPSITDCYQILGLVHSTWRPLPGRIKDYIAFPKPNEYRSIHTTIFTGDGGILEIQIRTEEMHREAEFGVASHLIYKGKGKAKTDPITWLKSLLPRIPGVVSNTTVSQTPTKYSYSDVPHWIKELATLQPKDNENESFLEHLKIDFFGERIFVFTPKGDVVDLPIGSSPVDFAFAIHSAVGEHMSGAKVNGKLTGFDTTLQNGDIVEITTKKGARPNRKWLASARTTGAKKKILASLQRLEQDSK